MSIPLAIVLQKDNRTSDWGIHSVVCSLTTTDIARKLRVKANWSTV